jgi:hypothetical protein
MEDLPASLLKTTKYNVNNMHGDVTGGDTQTLSDSVQNLPCHKIYLTFKEA